MYDLTQRPQAAHTTDVTVLGMYLAKPGTPPTVELLPGLNTAIDGVNDAQPIYASVACDASGVCSPDTTAIGEAATGAVWLEGFPTEVASQLHRPSDATWGMVEVTGRFEVGQWGPNGSYRYRIAVASAKAMQPVERVVAAVTPGAAPTGQISFFDLADRPADFAGQRVTTQAYYFWTPATSGLLVERVAREQASNDPKGLNPQPEGRIIALDGFPPDLSQQLNVGAGNSYVWGLIELTGTFETNGTWGPQGQYTTHFVIDGANVRIVR